MPSADPERQLELWARDQRALARTLGLSIEDWLHQLAAAANRPAPLTAAVIGACSSRGLGLSVLNELSAERLVEAARELIDPKPPRVENAILVEAIRQSAQLGIPEGRGKVRLRARARSELPTPKRGAGKAQPSAGEATADAPGVGGGPDGEEE